MAVPQFPLLGKGATLSPALCSEGKYEDLTSALVARSLAAVTPGLNAKYSSKARERAAARRVLCGGSSPERGGGSFRLRALPKPRAAPGLHLAPWHRCSKMLRCCPCPGWDPVWVPPRSGLGALRSWVLPAASPRPQQPYSNPDNPTGGTGADEWVLSPSSSG